MDSKWIFRVLFLLSVNAIGSLCDDDDDKQKENDKWSWTGQLGLGVLIVIICIICGFISLISWLSCIIYDKCRTDRVGVTRLNKGGTLVPPLWAQQLAFQPDLSAGFGLMSDGLISTQVNQVIRTTEGSAVTDGAKWSVPMTKGKHVFEISWPWAQRGAHGSVGVATDDAPIKRSGTQPLVGSTAHSWGLDIVRRRTMHINKALKVCPTDGSYVPDKFLMYVDMDEGTLGFGNDVTYWGEVITDLPKQGTTPLYVMIGVARWQANIVVIYKGSAREGAFVDPKNQSRPHNLPPLNTMPIGVIQAPPTYMEASGNNGPSIARPMYPVMEKPSSPPPAYSSPAMAHKTRPTSASDGPSTSTDD